MLLLGNNNVKTKIINAYYPTVTASSGGAYSQKLESLAIMKIHNGPRTQFWIDLNIDISKLIHHGEQNILMGYWNSEASEVKIWMETQGLTNEIFNLHGYSDALITYQR